MGKKVIKKLYYGKNDLPKPQEIELLLTISHTVIIRPITDSEKEQLKQEKVSEAEYLKYVAKLVIDAYHEAEEEEVE